MKRPSVRSYDPCQYGQVVESMALSRARRRNSFPALPAEFAEAPVSEWIPVSHTSGAMALSDDGSLAGCLFAERREDPVWGPSVVAESDGWAYSQDIYPDTLALMYGIAFGPATVGAHRHVVRCPASDKAMLDAWFHLGFGIEQAFAVARLDGLEPICIPSTELEIRHAEAGDEDILERLSPTIAVVQSGAPVWAGAPDAYLADLREGFRAMATDEEAIALLAFRDGKAVGYQAWFPVRPVERRPAPWWHLPEGGVELSVGATIPEARRSGVGRCLTARGVAEALSRGYTHVFTDWRTANPLSSAFWPACGFQTFEYRLVRRIDPLAL